MAPRQFLTERLYREIFNATASGTTHPAMAWLHPAPPAQPCQPKPSISIEIGDASEKIEVETHVSDNSWAPSFSTATNASSQNSAAHLDQNILNELEQLRREKAQLLAENAALAADKGKAPSSLETASAVEQGGQTEPLGAPLRYLVTTPMGASSPCSFEFGQEGAAELKRCTSTPYA